MLISSKELILSLANAGVRFPSSNDSTTNLPAPELVTKNKPGLPEIVTTLLKSISTLLNSYNFLFK
jgi:hypothetical protein